MQTLSQTHPQNKKQMQTQASKQKLWSSRAQHQRRAKVSGPAAHRLSCLAGTTTAFCWTTNKQRGGWSASSIEQQQTSSSQSVRTQRRWTSSWRFVYLLSFLHDERASTHTTLNRHTSAQREQRRCCPRSAWAPSSTTSTRSLPPATFAAPAARQAAAIKRAVTVERVPVRGHRQWWSGWSGGC